jgi:hypothetical protein
LVRPPSTQQICWNLLTNALKFTPKSGRVEVHLRRLDDQIELAVSDNGIGIPPAFLPVIFDRFRQADSAPTRQYGGLGLGLAIVRHFTELHGGHVSAHSEGPGQGTTFRVRLPSALLREGWLATPATDELAPVNPGELESITALVVDDDPDSLQFVRDSLQSTGATVLSASARRGDASRRPPAGRHRRRSGDARCRRVGAITRVRRRAP